MITHWKRLPKGAGYQLDCWHADRHWQAHVWREGRVWVWWLSVGAWAGMVELSRFPPSGWDWTLADAKAAIEGHMRRGGT